MFWKKKQRPPEKTGDDIIAAWNAYTKKVALVDHLVECGLSPETAEDLKLAALQRFENLFHDYASK